MKVIIDISEGDYEMLKVLKSCGGRLHKSDLRILDGTPLPERHGRLIDADALEKKMCDREEELGDDRAMWESSVVTVALDMFAPTIIDADKE